MSIEVFWASGSPFSWRVQLALEVKGLPYESRLLEMSKGDLKKPEFLAINPRGLVPALRDGEVVVCESIAILAYLDRRYPEPPLFGRTPAEAGAIWQEVMASALYLDRADDFVLPMYFGRGVAEETKVRAALPLIDAELDRLERTLAQGPWLVGSDLSAADIAAYPMVRSLLRAAEKPDAARFAVSFAPMAARRPAVAAWMARVESLPGYDRTFPPHWVR